MNKKNHLVVLGAGMLCVTLAWADCNRPSTTYEKQDCNFKADRDFRRGNSEVDQAARRNLESLEQEAERKKKEQEALPTRVDPAEEGRKYREALKESERRMKERLLQQFSESERDQALREQHRQRTENFKREQQQQALDRAAARVAALQQTLSDKAQLSVRDYVGLVDAAVPDAELMLKWSGAGYLAYPREFALYHGVALSTQCPPHLLPKPGEGRYCARQWQDDALLRMSEVIEGGSLLDRVRFCGLVYNLNKSYSTQCERVIPEVSGQTLRNLWASLAKQAHEYRLFGINEMFRRDGHWQYQRWSYLVHPAWQQLAAQSFASDQAVTKIMADIEKCHYGRDKDGYCDLGGVAWPEQIGTSATSLVSRYSGQPEQYVQNQDAVSQRVVNEMKPYITVATWPGWLCADFKDGRDQSAWYRQSLGTSDKKIYDRNCEYWSQHPPGKQ